MQSKIIEATNRDAGGLNWGKFMVCRFTVDEWAYRSIIGERALLHTVGWTRDHLFVIDLQTGEGAMFRPGGLAVADLNRHRIWVCPMFEPFLKWLYNQDLSNVELLPPVVQIDDPTSDLYGYRHLGANQ